MKKNLLRIGIRKLFGWFYIILYLFQKPLIVLLPLKRVYSLVCVLPIIEEFRKRDIRFFITYKKNDPDYDDITELLVQRKLITNYLPYIYAPFLNFKVLLTCFHYDRYPYQISQPRTIKQFLLKKFGEFFLQKRLFVFAQHGLVSSKIPKPPYFWNNFDYVLATGEHDYKKISEKISNNTNIVKIGFPKLDPLFFPTGPTNSNRPSNKTIFFAPTWGNLENVTIFLFFLKEYCVKRSDSFVIFRPHDVDRRLYRQRFEKLIRIAQQSENMIFIPNAQVMSAYKKANVLISDDSSSITEFLVMNKPVIRMPFSRRVFEERNFSSDKIILKLYSESTYTVNSKYDLFNQLDNLLNRQYDPLKERCKHHTVSDLLIYNKGRATLAVCNFIESLF